MKIPNLENFRAEKAVWEAAGKPVRNDERIEELFKLCSSNICHEYEGMSQNIGQCQICTCFVRRNGDKINKLKWATTKCPLKLWKEEPGFEQVEKKELELPEDNPSPNVLGVPNRRKTGGCNCG